jgi:hypothetical protein
MVHGLDLPLNARPDVETPHFSLSAEQRRDLSLHLAQRGLDVM